MAGEPFLWGKGGRRMTPDQIEQERAIAASLSQVDYSPVQHWTQGAARLGGNLLGAFRERRANKASEQNLTDSNLAMAKLLAPQADTAQGGVNPAIAEILANPYLDGGVRKLAMDQYSQATKRAQPIEVNGKLVDPATMQVLGDFSTPTEIERILSAAGYQPGTPEYVELMRQAAQNKANPMQAVSGVDEQGNQVLRFLRPGGMAPGGAGPTGAPPATLPPDFDFGAGGPTPSASGGFR